MVNEINYCYILHDCTIDDILLCKNGVSLLLNKGIYVNDIVNGAINKIDKCRLNIYINGFNEADEYAYINIHKVHNGRYKHISLNKLIKIIRKKHLKIYLDFYSDYAKMLLLQGTSYPYEIEIKISDVQCFAVEKII